MRTYSVYILANEQRMLYVGVTGNLARRMAEHRASCGSRFASRHGISRLVHVESTSSVVDAIRREKEIKGWRRSKRIALIEAQNPEWIDYAVG